MDPYAQTIIDDTNIRYFGIDQTDLAEQAGTNIAHLLLKRFGGGKTIAFVCGLGTKGAYGFAAATELAKAQIPGITVYLIGRQNEIKTDAGKELWEKFKATKTAYKQDAFGTDIVKHDIIVECLTDEVSTEKLFKRFHDVVYRITRLKSNLVAIDHPAPGYSWNYAISFNFPKTADAETINLQIPDNILNHVGPGEVKLIATPKRFSYKSQNGQVLIIGGSEQFHGAPVIAAQAAANYAGMVYLYTPVKSSEIIDQMNQQSTEFMNVDDSNLASTIERVDSILIGPGLLDNFPNRALINKIAHDFPSKKFVIDAAAIGMIDFKLVKQSGNIIFTPHRGELHYLVNEKVTEPSGVIKRFAREHNCFINLKSATSILVGAKGEFKFNASGNPGMAKAGTGDALAGLTAAFASKNDSWTSMTAAAFVNGIAGELVAKEFGNNYSVTELIANQQRALKLCQEF